MQAWERYARENGAHDDRLSQRAVARGCEGQHNAAVKGGGLVGRLLQRKVEVEVETAVRGDVIAHLGQQHKVVKALRLGGVEIGGKHACGSVGRVGRPGLGVGDEQDLLPVRQRGYNLQHLGQLARLVPSQVAPHLCVHLYQARVHLWRGRGALLRHAHRALARPLCRSCLALSNLLHDHVRQRAPRARPVRHKTRQRRLILCAC